MRKSLFIGLVFIIAVGIVGCTVWWAVVPPKVQPPVVKLNRVEVAHYWPFWIEPKKKRGSTLDLAFVFDITNPNKFKVMLDQFRFTTAFEGFELSTPIVYEDIYIPAKTTSQLRVEVTYDAYTALLALLVPAGNVEMLKKKGVKHVNLLKSWWEKVGDFAFPIEVRNGVASFTSDYGEVISSFKATFPPKK